jgi:hypothetical protein
MTKVNTKNPVENDFNAFQWRDLENQQHSGFLQQVWYYW